MGLKLLDFINENENWEELLAAPPYCLTIKHDGDYVLLKYDQMLSDMTNEICLEARGIIFRKGITEGWWCPSYGFKKFFNYNEVYSDLKNIKWDGCNVTEKVDGTNIRIYMDLGVWRVSTLGCIDAFKAQFNDELSYGDLVVKACGGKLENLTNQLQPGFCYIFELTGPNRIVINYGDEPYLWYLGRRNQVTFKEDFGKVEFSGVTILRPRVVEGAHTLTECVHLIEEMGGDEEGFVVTSVDESGEPHRVKMKGAEYLRLHKLRCNGPLTIMKVLKLWRAQELDDFLSAFPEFKEYVDSVFNGMKQVAALIEKNCNDILNQTKDRKEIANLVRTYLPPTPAYTFAYYDGKVSNGMEFLNRASNSHLYNYLEGIVAKEDKNGGTVEDE